MTIMSYLQIKTKKMMKAKENQEKLMKKQAVLKMWRTK